MSFQTPKQTKLTQAPMQPSAAGLRGVLRRKCACGGSRGLLDSCTACSQQSVPQRKVVREQAAHRDVPPIVQEVLSSSGQPLADAVRSFMEPRFGHDFSRVRVHTDALAAQSSRAVDALAYTVGNHIVFGEGRYSPNSAAGRKLLAHELTHVTQNPARSAAPDELAISDQPHLEAEAESVADSIKIGTPTAAAAGRATATGLHRQKTGTPAKPKTDADIINEARAVAYLRVQKALQRVRSVAPEGPKTNPKDPDLEAIEAHLESTRLAQVLFKWSDPNMSQVEEILGKMATALRPGASIVEAKASDPNCVGWAAYTAVIGTPPIVFCPKLVAKPVEERIETLVHESAHVAGIGQLKGEGYCVTFDCNAVCGNGFGSADAWAHYVHCLSGQAPQPATAGNPNPAPAAPTPKPQPKGKTKP